MKCMFIGGILIILSIITLFIPFSTYLKNPTEEMMWTGAVAVIFGILIGILIFVIGVIQKLQGKQKMNKPQLIVAWVMGYFIQFLP